MAVINIAIDRRASESFGKMLADAGIGSIKIGPKPGEIVSSAGDFISLASDASWPAAVATVLVAWIRAKRTRRAIVTLNDHRVVHLETTGMSAAETAVLLDDAKRLMIIELPDESGLPAKPMLDSPAPPN